MWLSDGLASTLWSARECTHGHSALQAPAEHVTATTATPKLRPDVIYVIGEMRCGTTGYVTSDVTVHASRFLARLATPNVIRSAYARFVELAGLEACCSDNRATFTGSTLPEWKPAFGC